MSTIQEPFYKKKPFSTQLEEMCADYRRDNQAHKANGGVRSRMIPPVLMDTARRADVTAAELRSALGVSRNTLYSALKNANISLPRSGESRSVTEALAGEQPTTPPVFSLLSILKETHLATANVTAADQGRKDIGDQAQPPKKLKAGELAVEVAKRMVGDVSDRLIPGTYRGRDGYERCDGFVGQGPDARPLVWAWREKAAEVESVLRLVRAVQIGQ